MSENDIEALRARVERQSRLGELRVKAAELRGAKRRLNAELRSVQGELGGLITPRPGRRKRDDGGDEETEN